MIHINLDPEVEAKLREALGPDLDRAAREALVAEAYRMSRLSIGQAARLLDLSIDAAYGFMKQRGISVGYDLDDFESDLATRAAVQTSST